MPVEKGVAQNIIVQDCQSPAAYAKRRVEMGSVGPQRATRPTSKKGFRVSGAGPNRFGFYPRQRSQSSSRLKSELVPRLPHLLSPQRVADYPRCAGPARSSCHAQGSIQSRTFASNTPGRNRVHKSHARAQFQSRGVGRGATKPSAGNNSLRLRGDRFIFRDNTFYTFFRCRKDRDRCVQFLDRVAGPYWARF